MNSTANMCVILSLGFLLSGKKYKYSLLFSFVPSPNRKNESLFVFSFVYIPVGFVNGCLRRRHAFAVGHIEYLRKITRKTSDN